MEILLLRHGQTRGNLERRYIGRTDEPLLESARESLRKSSYREFQPEIVYVSPMFRCRETAEILFGDDYMIDRNLREMDFGDFENKNYEQLKDESIYQAWIDSGGMSAFPGGEDPKASRMRCRKAFERDVEEAVRKEVKRIAFVVHGGTIMSVMEEYGTPRGDFYRWQVGNGEGVILRITSRNFIGNVPETK
ncbi:MAG: histidine phosphatase family protein [Clostridiales bacterium]|nr:histidine phosphatase family protein [Clostridiales bacterium]